MAPACPARPKETSCGPRSGHKDASGTTTTKTVEYAYDGFDRRISTTVTDYVSGVAQTPTTEFYVYDEGAQSRGDVILDFVDSDGPSGNAPAVSKRYLWGQAIDQLFAQEDLTQTLSDTDRYAWLLQDRLNTVRDVLNRDGTVAAHIDYDSFGEIESVSDVSGSPTALPTRFTFTGQELDSNTGQYWFSDGSRQGRAMSPSMMRFVQPDPGGFIDGVNLVVYVHNSPTNWNDPSGQFNPRATLNSFRKLIDDLPSQLKKLTPEARTMMVDVLQFGLDIAGIFDPTPLSDSLSVAISACRGDITGVAVGIVSFIPWFGDVSKIAKVPKYVKSVTAAIEFAFKNPDFFKTLLPAFKNLDQLLKNLPLGSFPEAVAKQLEKLRDLVSKAANSQVHHLATREGRWGDRFKAMFKDLGIDIDDAVNKMVLPGHCGSHIEEYHRYVFEKLKEATRGKTGDDARKALIEELAKIRKALEKDPRLPYANGGLRGGK